LQLVGGVAPGRDLLVAYGQLRVLRDDTELLLAREGLFPQRVPPAVEPALVLRRPLRRHVVWRMGRAGGEVGEEGLVRHQRLLLADPLDGTVRQVLRE